MLRRLLTALVFLILPVHAETMTVAVLHPLLADLAKQVGGDHVEVVELIGPNGDPHHFEPAPEDLKRAETATLFLASGMGLESYLPKLKAIIAGKARLVEVGATLPSLEGACDHDHEDDHDHDHGHAIDPHWWHSIDLFRRATTVVAETFIAEQPENADEFRKNATAYRSQLDDLERWAKKEIAKIPRDRRHLATAHTAFNYLCKDFGFTPHPVQGLNREQMPDPKQLAELVAELKKDHIVAIFPEKESNPKILETLTHDTGIRLADPLVADGKGMTSYEQMMRHNIDAIVKGLSYEP
jgi:zinc/manganese transport system substrate-binding protein